MNERINDLWQQAACFVNPLKEGGDWQAEFVEKFAELIVRECMTICKEHPSRIVSNNWVADAVAPDVVRQFEEHFGVEE
jgi:hypothetical protein